MEIFNFNISTQVVVVTIEIFVALIIFSRTKLLAKFLVINNKFKIRVIKFLVIYQQKQAKLFTKDGKECKKEIK